MFQNEKTDASLKLIVGFITISFVLLSTSLCYSAEIDEIHAAISQRGATWIAQDNAISSLPREQRVKLLGLLPPDSKLTEMPVETFSPNVGILLPPSVDWRNNGGNFVSPIKNQGYYCGSCWAFATTAALESRAMISFNTPGKPPNLSEQIVLSCSGAGNCEDGGSISGASDFLVNTGTNKETYYPYKGADGYCLNANSSWTYRPYMFGSWSSVPQDLSALKSAIYSNGPVVVAMAVYTDFFYYGGGVYHPVWGGLEGYHAILAVGYNDDGQYFIVKNSWGTTWGASGYFKIAYSELYGYSNFAYQAISYGDVEPVAVNLLDPDGGDFVPSGGPYSITWEAPSDAYAFNLFYSLNNGTTWNPLASGVTGSTYDWWDVPRLLSNKKTCRVKIQEIDGSGSKVGEDSSSGPFTIEVVALTSPNGGEPVPSGGSWDITWTTNTPLNPVSSVKLYYTMDNGLTWKPITTLSGNPGSYSWQPVPTVTRDKAKCKVKVVLTYGAGTVVGSDISDSVFTITHGPI